MFCQKWVHYSWNLPSWRKVFAIGYNTVIKSSSRFDKEKNNKMIMNLKESIKGREQAIKRLASVQPDVKGSARLAKSFQDAVLSALELRLLKASF